MQRCLVCHKRHADGVPFVELYDKDRQPRTTRAADPGIILLGCSSDHLMLDVTDSQRSYQVGDVVELIPGYFSLLRAFTSPYVEKDFVPT